MMKIPPNTSLYKRCAIVCWVLWCAVASLAHELSVRDSLINHPEVRDEVSSIVLVDLLQSLYDNGEKEMSYCCAEALSQYGWFLIHNNEWSISKELFDCAVEYCPQDSVELYYSIKSGLAGVYLYRKEYDTAEKLFTEAYNFYRESNNQHEFIKACCNLGTLHKNLDDKVRAFEYYNQGLKIAEQNRHDIYYCIILNYIERLEEGDKIKYELLKRGSDISFENNFTLLYATNQLGLVRYYHRKGEYVLALETVNKAIQYAERYEQVAHLIDGYELKGRIYASQKDYAMAYSAMQQKVEWENKYATARESLIFSHQQYVYSLLEWCRNHVAPINGNSAVVIADKHYTTFWIVGAVMLLALIVVGFMAVKYCICYRKQILLQSAIVAPRSEEGEKNLQRDSEMEGMINYLFLFYNNYNQLLIKVKAMIRSCYKQGDAEQQAELRKISSFITQNMLPPKENPYSLRTDADNEAFIGRLETRFPDVTDTDKKLAVYLRMNLSTHEISLLTGNQLKSINMGRYRLRKALHLSSDEDLVAFLREV